MANLRILVPSGIGDVSWTLSKILTTPHNFHIRYIGGYPDRMRAFFDLLPKDRVISCEPESRYATKWENNELVCFPRPGNPPIKKAYKLSDLSEHEYCFLESNTHLEAGNRLEEWLKDEIPNTDFHYQLQGTVRNGKKSNYFIVNFSSYGTKKAWGYYEVPLSVEVVKHIHNKTGFTPIFIGGEYDDYTRDIHKHLIEQDCPAISLVGKTPDLVTVVALLQQSRMYFGACSGLMVLTNILNVPVATYYPPFNQPPGRKLAGMWHDRNIPYLPLFWEGKDKDVCLIDEFLKKL